MQARGEQGGRNTKDAQSENEDPAPVVPGDIAAEAAVWIARLHGPDRSPQMERECLDWQALSAVHRLAFERCTEVWEAVPRVRLADAYASSALQGSFPAAAWRGGGFRPRIWALASLLILGTVCAAIAINRWYIGDVYATQVGEQQVLMLEDGTRMHLNTHTRVRVKMSADRRRVQLESGEALFEVAKDAARPFVVRAAQSEVVAVGTAFSVRLEDDVVPSEKALAVTLIQGQITVEPVATAQSALATLARGLAPVAPVVMHAGERLRLTRPDTPLAPTGQMIDKPRIDELVAWERSEAVFDDVSLSEAVAEMNRYSRVPLVLVGGDAVSTLRVSGVYRTGESMSFARAVAALHGLVVREREGRLELLLPH